MQPHLESHKGLYTPFFTCAVVLPGLVNTLESVKCVVLPFKGSFVLFFNVSFQLHTSASHVTKTQQIIVATRQ